MTTDTITPQMAAAHDESATMEFKSEPIKTLPTTTPEDFIKLVKEHKDGEFVQTEADVGGNPL